VVWESRNGGQQWRRLAALDGNIVGATYGGAGATVLYAAVRGRGIFASSDGGATWEARSEGLPQREVERIIADPRSAETLLTCLSPVKIAGRPSACPAASTAVPMAAAPGSRWAPACPPSALPTPNFTSAFKGFAILRRQAGR